MKIQLHTIDALMEEMREKDKPSFIEAFPGNFLLAMGLLAVEKIQAVRSASVAAREGGGTAAVSFGRRLRHTPDESHPLAGCAFFIHPESGDGESAVTIGRAMQCDITIPDSSVSDMHSVIEVAAEGLFIVDSGSTNGTSVNLQRLDPHQRRLLSDEDIISLGRYSFQLLSASTLYGELSLLQAIDELEGANL